LVLSVCLCDHKTIPYWFCPCVCATTKPFHIGSVRVFVRPQNHPILVLSVCLCDHKTIPYWFCQSHYAQ
jgi:hypothetical protein